MANLKDLIVNGVARFVGKVYSSGGFVGNLEGTASNASKVNNLTVQTAVPANAKFTDTNTTYAAATQSAAGLMSAADKTKLDGVATGANAYSLPLAASGTRGGVKVGYTTSGKNYAVQLSNEQMYVNVPWTDNNTTYAAATTAANGLMTAADKVKLNGIATGANAYSLPLAASGTRGGVKIGYTANGKNYPVQLSNEQMYVNVPWTDNNTTYSAGTGLALSGTTFNVTIPRVAKDSKSIPGQNKVIFEEYTAGTSYNLPSNAWYHIVTMEGADTNYATQLALGMTTNAAYFRNYNNKTWGNWIALSANTTYAAVTTAANGLMTAADKIKLNGIATGANAYSLPDATSSVKGGVKVGSNITVSSGTISLSKANVTSALGYTPPTTNTTYGSVTTAANGLMTAADKIKLNGIATGANAYSLPDATSSVKGGVKIGSNISVSSGTISLSKANVTTALGYTPPTTNTTYAAVTTGANGLMTAADKIKLNGIATGANAYSLPLAASGTRGGVKIGYTANGKNYPVQLSNEQMYVNVPWTDNNTTYSAGTGLNLNGTQFRCNAASSGNYKSFTLMCGDNGVTEVGPYLDMHSSVTSTTDYDARLQCTGTGTVTINGKKILVDDGSGAMQGGWMVHPKEPTYPTLPEVRFTVSGSARSIVWVCGNNSNQVGLYSIYSDSAKNSAIVPIFGRTGTAETGETRMWASTGVVAVLTKAEVGQKVMYWTTSTTNFKPQT